MGQTTAFDFDTDAFYTGVKQHMSKKGGALDLRSLTVAQLERVVKLDAANAQDDGLVKLLFRKTFEVSGALEGLEREQFTLQE